MADSIFHEAAVALINPKYPRNVGNAIRACSNFGARGIVWTPERVLSPEDWPKGARLPREERMKLYREVDIITRSRGSVIDTWPALTPVAVEVRENAERLPDFQHPEDALYVFGPEDGTLDRGILEMCHRFVVIPATSCLNLAAAVNVVLYDRMAKGPDSWMPHDGYAYARAES